MGLFLNSWSIFLAEQAKLTRQKEMHCAKESQEVTIKCDSVFPIKYMLELRYTFPIKLQDTLWLHNGAEKEQVEETMVILKNGKHSPRQITRQVEERG